MIFSWDDPALTPTLLVVIEWEVLYTPSMAPTPATGGPVIAGTPKSDFVGFADKDNPNVTLDNNSKIIFSDGSYLIFNDGSNVVFSDPYGNPSAAKVVPIPRTEYFGIADL